MYFDDKIEIISGQIYIKESFTNPIWSEVFIVKGEIKHIRHINKSELIGEIELRINAYVTLYFQKFTGVISVKTSKSDICSIRLRPISDFMSEDNIEIIKLFKRIFKKNEINHVIGPTGQV